MTLQVHQNVRIYIHYTQCLSTLYSVSVYTNSVSVYNILNECLHFLSVWCHACLIPINLDFLDSDFRITHQKLLSWFWCDNLSFTKKLGCSKPIWSNQLMLYDTLRPLESIRISYFFFDALIFVMKMWNQGPHCWYYYICQHYTSITFVEKKGFILD